LLEVLASAGFAAVYPDGVAGLCCGMPFSSKGFAEAARLHAERTAEALWKASREGQDPVVTDASPCAATLADTVAARLAGSGRALRMLDFPRFWAVEVLPHLEPVPRRAGLAILHPTCTLVKAGGLPDLLAVARAHAEQVVVPASSECCGFAGDRGFLVPEVTRAATLSEAAEVRAGAAPDSGCYSTCRTCEIGLTQATGRRYASLVHLVWEALRGA
jgi:D-lactate dehydrogenase